MTPELKGPVSRNLADFSQKGFVERFSHKVHNFIFQIEKYVHQESAEKIWAIFYQPHTRGTTLVYVGGVFRTNTTDSSKKGSIKNRKT